MIRQGLQHSYIFNNCCLKSYTLSCEHNLESVKSSIIKMQSFHVDQSSNLLGGQDQQRKNLPPTKHHQRQHQGLINKLSIFVLSYGAYIIILLLVCVLTYDIKDFLTAMLQDSNNAFHNNQMYQPNSHDQTLKMMRKNDKQYKNIQALKETQYKNLRIIQLQRQILKINSILRSKQEYDNGLIVKQLQNLDNTKLKYWKFDQSHSNQEQVSQHHSQDQKYINKEIPSEQQTHFPKIVWMYIEENVSSESNLTQLLIGNLAEYLELQGYDFYLIGEYNFRYLISNRHEEQLGYVLVDLWHLAYETNLTTNLMDHTFTIKKHLLSLIMLAEMGGILIDKDVILTQPLDWLEDFRSITLANKGRIQTPNVIGFYHPNYTDSLQAIDLEEGLRKQVHLYPPLDPYFLAVSTQGKQFIQKVLQHYYVLLEFPHKIKEVIAKYELSLRELNGNDPYYEAIYFAFSWVLKKKQIQLQQSWAQSGKQALRPLAIDHYGIFAINRIYGPLKYRFLFSEMNQEHIYHYLTKIDYNDLSEQFGKISYISFIPFGWKIEELAGKAQEGQVQYQVYKESFMGQFVYKGSGQAWITNNNPVKQSYWIQNGLVWNSLPKRVWVYMEKKSMVNQMCLLNILQSASYSHFEVVVLTPTNLEEYLSKTILQSIQKAYNQIRLTFNKTFIENVGLELIKLAILNEHGGVWLDLPMFTLEGFNWIIQIHQNQYVINKKGRLPKTLLFYHPIEAAFPYSCHQSCKIQQNLSFETSAIISEPQNSLFSIWLKEIIQNLSLEEQKFKEKLSNVNMSYKSIKNGAQLSQLTLDYIQISRNRRFGHRIDGSWALSQFEVWAISSFTGLDKFKEYTNFDVGFDSNNIYLWSLPTRKATALVGEFRYFVQLSSRAESFLNRQFRHRNQFHLHPQSILAQHLINETLLNQLLKEKGVGALEYFRSAHHQNKG